MERRIKQLVFSVCSTKDSWLKKARALKEILPFSERDYSKLLATDKKAASRKAAEVAYIKAAIKHARDMAI